MPKQLKTYIGRDVLSEAKYRIRHILNAFDQVWVAFSGGKDSLAVLHLVREVMDEDGCSDKPVDCLFYDEELIYQSVLDFVDKYRLDARYNLRYYAVPLQSQKFILGKTHSYIQWDECRKWIRPKPEYAIASLPGNGASVQNGMEEAIFRDVPGNVAILTGIRADESLIRLQSCTVKLNENYINTTDTSKVKRCKPIFDWHQSDVFRYFYDRQISYCALYDQQIWNDLDLRVSTPIHAESAKRFHYLRSLDPVLYEQIIGIFPEMLTQERYWQQWDDKSYRQKYEKSWNGIRDYINDEITDEKTNKIAHDRVNKCERLSRKTNSKYKDIEDGGYPILYVFHKIVSGAFKRNILPLSHNKMTKEMKQWQEEYRRNGGV